MAKKAIFISYRRDDSAGHAGRLYDRLVAEFGEDAVFIDIHAIEDGIDFVVAIDQAIDESKVFLAVIGKQWLLMADQFGRRRIDQDDDFVRIEIEKALGRPEMRVIPVLVRDASMPALEGLPQSIKSLSRRNARNISDDRFHYDVDQLIEVIKSIIRPPLERETKPPVKPFTRVEENRKYKLLSLGAVARLISSGKSKSEKTSNGQYAVYGAGGIIGRTNNYDFEGQYLLVVRVGNNLFKLGASINKTDPNEKFAINTNLLVVKNSDLVLFDYLYYYLKVIDFSPLAVGSAQPSINWKRLSMIEIVVPPLKVQQAFIDELELKLQKDPKSDELQRLQLIKDVLVQYMD